MLYRSIYFVPNVPVYWNIPVYLLYSYIAPQEITLLYIGLVAKLRNRNSTMNTLALALIEVVIEVVIMTVIMTAYASCKYYDIASVYSTNN